MFLLRRLLLLYIFKENLALLLHTVSESMAGFLAAEQMVSTQGADVRDSKVAAAIDSAQNQQEMYNSIRQKVAKGNSCFNGF